MTPDPVSAPAAATRGPDFAGVLTVHHHWSFAGKWIYEGGCVNQQGAPCGWAGSKGDWRSHVVACLNIELMAWLTCEDSEVLVARTLNPDYNKGAAVVESRALRAAQAVVDAFAAQVQP